MSFCGGGGGPKCWFEYLPAPPASGVLVVKGKLQDPAGALHEHVVLVRSADLGVVFWGERAPLASVLMGTTQFRGTVSFCLRRLHVKFWVDLGTWAWRLVASRVPRNSEDTAACTFQLSFNAHSKKGLCFSQGSTPHLGVKNGLPPSF